MRGLKTCLSHTFSFQNPKSLKQSYIFASPLSFPESVSLGPSHSFLYRNSYSLYLFLLSSSQCYSVYLVKCIKLLTRSGTYTWEKCKGTLQGRVTMCIWRRPSANGNITLCGKPLSAVGRHRLGQGRVFWDHELSSISWLCQLFYLGNTFHLSAPQFSLVK